MAPAKINPLNVTLSVVCLIGHPHVSFLLHKMLVRLGFHQLNEEAGLSEANTLFFLVVSLVVHLTRFTVTHKLYERRPESQKIAKDMVYNRFVTAQWVLLPCLKWTIPLAFSALTMAELETLRLKCLSAAVIVEPLGVYLNMAMLMEKSLNAHITALIVIVFSFLAFWMSESALALGAGLFPIPENMLLDMSGAVLIGLTAVDCGITWVVGNWVLGKAGQGTHQPVSTTEITEEEMA